MNEDPLPLGSREDRQEALQAAALEYVLRYGLGPHFLQAANTGDVGDLDGLTREEVEELQEAAFDPRTNPRSADLHMYIQRRLG